MPDKYITLFSSLVSGLVGVFGALAGVYLNNRTQRSQQKADRLRERGEELYSLGVEWLDGLFFFSLRRCHVMRGEVTYNECLDQDIKWGASKKTAPVTLRLEMLVNVYFPATQDAYKETVRHRSEMNDIEAKFKRLYSEGDTDGSQFLGPYVNAQKLVELSGNAFLQQVIEEIRKID